MSEPKLRIAQVAPLWASIPPVTYGGIELVVHLLTEELVRRGHEVTLFATGDSRTSARLRPVCDRNLLAMMTDGSAGLYEYYANAAGAEALREPGEFDVIHFHAGNALAPIAASSDTPSLFTIHTFIAADDEWVFPRYPRARPAGISRFQVEKLSATLKSEVPVVYNGIDFESYDPCFEPGEYLVFLGRLSHDKNPLDAIRIARKLDLPIVLAGQPQSALEEEYFKKNVQPLLDGNRVKWIGPVNHEQKNRLLRNASALVFPVNWPEPFGLVMVEAMACGTPVVAHAVGSVPEVVDQGVTGFHSDSIAALDDLIPQALALDRRRVREHAAARFSHQRMVDAYVALYRSLVR